MNEQDKALALRIAPNSDDLLPCPFCGEHFILEVDSDGKEEQRYYYHPQNDCVLSMQEVEDPDVKDWNRRPASNAARIAELEAEVERLKENLRIADYHRNANLIQFASAQDEAKRLRDAVEWIYNAAKTGASVDVIQGYAKEAKDFTPTDTAELDAMVEDAEYGAQAKRLALELECLLMDTKDLAVVSKWWDSAHEALEGFRAINAARRNAGGTTECGNCFEGKSDMDHKCQKCGGTLFIDEARKGGV